MDILCIENFKLAFDKLIKNNSYKAVEREIIAYFLNKTADQVSSGTLLNNNLKFPYLKKRLDGSGGFRVYFYILFIEDRLILSYIHPKSGSEGKENLSLKERTDLIKATIVAIKNNNLYKISEVNSKLLFERIL